MEKTFSNLLNMALKMGVAVVGLIIVLIAVHVAHYLWQERHGRCYWNDKLVSENVVAYGYNDNTQRVYNVKSGRFTTDKVAWVSSRPLHDSLTVYADRSGYRGFLNALTGEIVLNSNDFRFLRAWHFSNGKAFVQGENGNLGVIDHDGHLCIPFEIPFEIGQDYVFRDGLCKIVRYEYGEGWYQGLLLDDGTWALPMQYRYISDPNEEGYRILADKEGKLLVDSLFSQVFDRHYDDISFAMEGDGVYLMKNRRKWKVDYSGEVLQPFVFDGTHELSYVVRYHEDEADEYELDDELMVYEVGQWEGIFNKITGKVVTPADYWSLTMVSRNIIRACLYGGEGCVFLNRKGQVIDQE